MINPDELESNQEFERKVSSAFQTQDPDQLFVDRLAKRLVDRFIENKRLSKSGPSHWKDKIKTMFSPLAWGTIAVILVLSLAWGIKTLIPRVEPGINAQPSPAISPTPLTVSTQAETAKPVIYPPTQAATAEPVINPPTQAVTEEAEINPPTPVKAPMPWPKIPITAENASQLTELMRLGRGPVSGIAWSPDGKTVAVASSTGIYLYNAETYEEVSTIAKDPGIYEIIYSPNGAMLVGSDGDSARMWDVTSGNVLITLPKPGNFGGSSAISPDGELLAFSYSDSEIGIWNISNGKAVSTIKEANSSFGPFFFSTDGTMLVALSRPWTRSPDGSIGYFAVPGPVKIWDVVSGTQLRTLADCIGYNLLLSPDNRTVAVLQDDGILFCDVKSGSVINKLNVNAHHHMKYSPDGTILAGGVDNSIKLWDAATLEELTTLPEQDEGVEWIAFSPDGKRLAAASSSSVKIWDIARGIELQTLTGYTPLSNVELGRLEAYGRTTNVAFSPDGKLLAVGHSEGKLNLYDLDTLGLIAELETRATSISAITFSPDGKLIAASGYNQAEQKHRVQIWDVATHELRIDLGNFMDYVWSLAFSPDSSMLVTGAGTGYGYTEEPAMKIWDVSTGELIIEYGKQPHTDIPSFTTIYDVAFIPNSTLLAGLYDDGSVFFWDIIQQKEVSSRPSIGKRGYCFAISPDGSRLAIGYQTYINSAYLQVSDLQTGEVLFTQVGFASNVRSLTFSPNGQILTSGSWDETVQLWDVETGKLLETLTGLATDSLAFRPDGTLLVTGGETVRFWGIVPAKSPQP